MEQYKETDLFTGEDASTDEVAHFSLTQTGYFTGRVNYAGLSNQEHFSYSLFFQQTVKINEWNRFASFDYRSYPIL